MLLLSDINDTITRCEIEGIRRGIAATRRLYPDEHAEGFDIAGGLAAFTGVGSPLSQAYGVGSAAPVTDSDVARITAFYESRAAVPRVFVTPLADPSLGVLLARAGYEPAEYENVLVCDDYSRARRDDRVVISSDIPAWARASTESFLDRTRLEPGDDKIATILASSEGVCLLEARNGEEIVATAAMDFCGDCSALFAGSTMPGYRNRGWHIVMIRDRMARARDGGARLLRATAKPASVSENNFRRCGFEVLYTRTLWERAG